MVKISKILGYEGKLKIMLRVNLVSGGVDSYIMSQEYKGTNVYIDFGQSYAFEEQQALDKLKVSYEKIQVTAKFNNKDIYINSRNLTLISLINTIYSPDEIFLAGLKDDNCIDKTEHAFEEISEILSKFSKKPIQVISPYWNKTKGDIIANFKDKNSLVNTFSCYFPQNHLPCGNCPACLRRVIALETNGIETGLKLSDSILNEYLKKIHKYNPDRVERFFIYLNKIQQNNTSIGGKEKCIISKSD